MPWNGIRSQGIFLCNIFGKMQPQKTGAKNAKTLRFCCIFQFLCTHFQVVTIYVLRYCYF